MATNWNTVLYDSRHSFVWRYGRDLLELLAPQPGERILDLGCGTGHLTNEIAQSDAEVVGLDASPEMVEQARQNYPNLRFQVADARDFAFAEPFDAVFSNAVLHWIKPPEPVVACISRALKPGGRFVAEFGGKGNIRALVDGLYSALTAFGIADADKLNPWYYPSVGEYASLLEKHGLDVTYAALFDRLTPLEPGDDAMHAWLEQFAGAFTEALPPAQRSAFLDRVVEEVRTTLHKDGVWHVDYRRLRVVAMKSFLSN
jgi:trans-aconitate 2-methyltransferase